MKSFKVDGFKFAILPIITIAVIVVYVLLFMKTTPLYINIVNIGLDVLILILYLRLFIYSINVDDQGIDVKGAFVKKRVLVSELKALKQGGILTLIKTEKGRFFIISSKKEKEVIKSMFKDF